MKRIILILVLMVPIIALGQETVKPKFPGGEAELNAFVKANFKLDENYLTLAKNKYTMMTCKINAEGEMYGVEVKYTQIMTTAKNDINTELKRVLMLVAEKYIWIPAETDGKKVEAEQIITFTFNSDGDIKTKIGTGINGEVEVVSADLFKMKTDRKSVSQGNEGQGDGVIEEVEDDEEVEIEWVEMEQVEAEEEVVEEEIEMEEQPVFFEIMAEEVEEEVEEEPMIEVVEDDEEIEDDIMMFDIIAKPTAPNKEERGHGGKGDGEGSGSKIFTIVEVMPQFPGGNEAFEKFIIDNIIMPAKAIEEDAEGSVFVEFIVDEIGKVKDIKVVRDGIGYGCGEEALRVMRLMAERYTWKPGEQGSRKVAVRMTYPISFRAE